MPASRITPQCARLGARLRELRWSTESQPEYGEKSQKGEVKLIATQAGKSITRVRVVTVPHSDYVRWGLTVAPLNIAVGEDVRWLPRHLTGDIGFPVDDCWRAEQSSPDPRGDATGER